MRHTLQSTNESEVPDIGDQCFLDPFDVAAYAAAGGLLRNRKRCESWHLDREGAFHCGTRATSADSLAKWADDPSRLVQAFLEGRAEGACTPLWVIVDERPGSGSDVVGEHDAEQFVRLKRQLEVAGMVLVDALIFDDHQHWWSMNELLTGSTDWVFHPVRAG